jgi:hypothetical protein
VRRRTAFAAAIPRVACGLYRIQPAVSTDSCRLMMAAGWRRLRSRQPDANAPLRLSEGTTRMLVDMLLPLGTILVAAVAAFSISAVIGVVVGRLGLLEPHGAAGASGTAPQPRPED